MTGSTNSKLPIESCLSLRVC